MATTITDDELASRLGVVLDHVRRGERFVVERAGRPIAVLAPPVQRPSITWGEFLAGYFTWPRPDDRFADDLEAVQASQGRSGYPDWPDVD